MSMQQGDLFAAAPRIMTQPIEPYGDVIRDDSLIEFFRWGRRGTKQGGNHDQVCLEAAQHTDGRWMWAIHINAGSWGQGYRVGAKWGRFTATRAEAIAAACDEAMEAIMRRNPSEGMAAFDHKGAHAWLALTRISGEM